MLRCLVLFMVLPYFATGRVYDDRLVEVWDKIYQIKYSNIVDAGGITRTRTYDACVLAPPKNITFSPKKPFVASDFNITVLSTTKHGFVYHLQATESSLNRSKWVEFRYSAYFARKDVGHHCANNGWCINRQDKHQCVCRGNFTGEYCTEILKVCDPNPCVKGYCQVTDNAFQCECKYGYVGKTCAEGRETGLEKINLQGQKKTILKIPFKRCRPKKPLRVELKLMGNPKSMGVKIMQITTFGFKVRIRRKRRLQAKLKWNAYFGPDVFEQNPCMYGVDCTNTFDGHKCSCPSDYGGTYCEHERQTCYTRSCKNGGTCFNLEDGTLCYCPYGFTGKYCSKRINCTSQPCQNEGVCNNTGASYSCTCPEGFTSPDCSRTIQNCTKTSCKNGGRCRNTPEGFTCDCPPGQAGLDCSKQKVLPYDFSFNGCSGNGGKFRRNPDGLSFACDCKPSYAPSYCYDRYVDGKINMTLENSILYNGTIHVLYEDCHKEKAFWIEANFYKTFADLFEIKVTDNQLWGFSISVTQLALVDVDWSMVNTTLTWKAYIRNYHFKKNPCKNGGICSNSKQGQQCLCPPRFSGPLCEIEIQDCSIPCENGGTCVETKKSFKCECPEIYGGKYCHLRAYNGKHKFRLPRYENTQSYVYIMKPCVDGFPLSASAHISNLGKHSNDVVVTSAYKNYQGFYYTVRRNKGGRKRGHENLEIKWQLLYELKGYNRDYCHNGGKCLYITKYLKKCRCSHDYEGDRCQFHKTDCNSNPCQNGGTCHGNVEYVCTCLPGFTGKDCNYEIRFEGNIPTTITYKDIASWGRQRKSVSVTYPECIHKPAGVITAAMMYNGIEFPGIKVNVKENLLGGFRLKTKLKNQYIIPNFGVEWYANATIKWQAFVEPRNESVCENGGSCTTGKRKHLCNCTQGFLGDHCQQGDYCTPMPCANGATCSLTPNGYTCNCANGYFGYNCTFEIPEDLRLYQEIYPENNPNNVVFTHSWEN